MPHKIFLALVCWPFPILGLLFGLMSEGRPPLAAVTARKSSRPFMAIETSPSRKFAAFGKVKFSPMLVPHQLG